jgi:hypothetical protein
LAASGMWEPGYCRSGQEFCLRGYRRLWCSSGSRSRSLNSDYCGQPERRPARFEPKRVYRR